MLGEHPSYHQSITSDEAEHRLQKCGGHCYLTRFSESNERYILSVYQDIPTYTIKHYRITVERGDIYIEGKKRYFDSIRELLAFYENNRIDPAFKTIGRQYAEDEYIQSLREDEARTQRKQRFCTVL